MRIRLMVLGVIAAIVALMTSVAQAQTTCKTIEGPGYFAQACGTNPQVSGGPSGSSASTGTGPAVQSLPGPAASPTPVDTFTPVPIVTPGPTLTTPSPAPRPAPLGLIGALLRLLGLG